jgi:hypothetical protein
LHSSQMRWVTTASGMVRGVATSIVAYLCWGAVGPRAKLMEASGRIEPRNSHPGERILNRRATNPVADREQRRARTTAR